MEQVHRERGREPEEVKADANQLRVEKVQARHRAGRKAVKAAAAEEAVRAEDKEAVGRGIKKIRKGGKAMPGFDGRGPMGAGPLTGRGRGLCTGANSFYGRGFFRNRGQYPGLGYGRGLGRRVGWYDAPYRYHPMDAAMEIDALKAEAASMKNALDMIHREIANLEKKAAKSSMTDETDD
jgi:hypothetical protein